MKTCKVCHKQKPLDDFRYDVRAKDKRGCKCRDCSPQQVRHNPHKRTADKVQMIPNDYFYC